VRHAGLRIGVIGLSGALIILRGFESSRARQRFLALAAQAIDNGGMSTLKIELEDSDLESLRQSKMAANSSAELLVITPKCPHCAGPLRANAVADGLPDGDLQRYDIVVICDAENCDAKFTCDQKLEVTIRQ
jgi:hypothetical protein